MSDVFLWLAYGLFLLIMAPYAVIALAGIGSWAMRFFEPATPEEDPQP